jgi:PIN domain nuclease of toxin-antitoxin system
MNYLLDSHVIIWLAEIADKLSQRSMDISRNRENKLFVSIVSFWEMSLKVNSGKLKLDIGLSEIFEKVRRSNISIIPVKEEHLLHLSALPLIHKDPFDRMLISISAIEEMTIITIDGNIHRYDISWVW